MTVVIWVVIWGLSSEMTFVIWVVIRGCHLGVVIWGLPSGKIKESPFQRFFSLLNDKSFLLKEFFSIIISLA
jgi:hypothetical protein